MSRGLFADWKTTWKLRQGTAIYVASLCAEPEDEDVSWLAAATTGDTDRARWELRYAKRALGLLVAERDTLDDRTSSMVSRQLRETMRVDRNVAAGMVRVAERQFSERLGSYRAALAVRNVDEATGARLGRTLLQSAKPDSYPPQDPIVRAGDILTSYLAAANESLRLAFGAADLPPDQPPSALLKSRSKTR